MVALGRDYARVENLMVPRFAGLAIKHHPAVQAAQMDQIAKPTENPEATAAYLASHCFLPCLMF
jgi:hypothetical protein